MFGNTTACVTEAKRLGVPAWFDDALGMRFVLIPAGKFVMGSPAAAEGITRRLRIAWSAAGVLLVASENFKSLAQQAGAAVKLTGGLKGDTVTLSKLERATTVSR